MQLSLALFDPSRFSSDGSYWSWYAPGLGRALLDRLYYDVAMGDRPADPNRLEPEAVVGGFARIDSGWVFGYRFGDGGRDTAGRPGRFVLVAAGVAAEEAAEGDLSLLVDSEPIRRLLAAARNGHAVPCPEDLRPQLVAERPNADPVVVRRIIETGRATLSGGDVLRKAAAVCAALPPDWQWCCHLCIQGERAEAIIERRHKPQAVPCEPSETASAHVESRPAQSTSDFANAAGEDARVVRSSDPISSDSLFGELGYYVGRLARGFLSLVVPPTKEVRQHKESEAFRDPAVDPVVPPGGPKTGEETQADSRGPRPIDLPEDSVDGAIPSAARDPQDRLSFGSPTGEDGASDSLSLEGESAEKKSEKPSNAQTNPDAATLLPDPDREDGR